MRYLRHFLCLPLYYMDIWQTLCLSPVHYINIEKQQLNINKNNKNNYADYALVKCLFMSRIAYRGLMHYFPQVSKMARCSPPDYNHSGGSIPPFRNHQQKSCIPTETLFKKNEGTATSSRSSRSATTYCTSTGTTSRVHPRLKLLILTYWTHM